jgi:hypothetical protein
MHVIIFTNEGRRACYTMEQLYDRALKALMEDHAAEMLPELLPGAELVSIENTELNRPNLRADLVYFIRYQGEPRILNLELQTGRDNTMNYRMLQYYVELLGRYEMPIISMVMYPFQTSVQEPLLQQESGTGTSLSFQYEILRLWLEDAEQCLRRGVVSMYTLLPAMKGVTVAMLFQAITEIEGRYPQPHLTRHLLRFQTILRRSKTLSQQDKQKVEARMKSYDSLLDGDVELQKEIQELVERRAEEEIQKGLQRGFERLQREAEILKLEAEERQKRVQLEAEERQKRVQLEAENSIIAEQQQTVLYVVEARFPTLLDVARQNVPLIKSRSELSLLAKQILRAPDETFARWALDTFVA